jgi:hypothetical protein
MERLVLNAKFAERMSSSKIVPVRGLALSGTR